MADKIVPVSSALQAKWAEYRAALDAAALPITGAPLALSPFYAHDLPSANDELDRALKSVKAETVSGGFEQDSQRNLSIRLSW
jgi:hypothetical protein